MLAIHVASQHAADFDFPGDPSNPVWAGTVDQCEITAVATQHVAPKAIRLAGRACIVHHSVRGFHLYLAQSWR
jgi:hypothetical protein